MKKTASFSATDVSPYGVEMIGPGVLDNSAALIKMIRNDANLSFEKKESMLALLDNPQTFQKLMAGVTGSKITDALAEYRKMNPISRMLLGLTGFSLGQKIYQIFFTQGQFTRVDSERNKFRVKV